jgi:hypothetical protein
LHGFAIANSESEWDFLHNISKNYVYLFIWIREGSQLSQDKKERERKKKDRERERGKKKRERETEAETAPVKGRSHRVSVVYLCNNTSGREQGG